MSKSDLDDLFKRVTFAGSEDLPKDHHGLPVVIDDEDDDGTKHAQWEEPVYSFKGNQERNENGVWTGEGGKWTDGGGSDVVPRGWSKKYPGLKPPKDDNEDDALKFRRDED